MFKLLYTIALKSISYVPYGFPYTPLTLIISLFEEKMSQFVVNKI